MELLVIYIKKIYINFKYQGFILVVVSLTGNGLGLMTGSMFSNPSLATAMAPVI